jgi:hypothetical protein
VLIWNGAVAGYFKDIESAYRPLAHTLAEPLKGEPALANKNLNENEAAVFRQYFQTILNAPGLEELQTAKALLAAAQSGPRAEPLPENCALYIREKAHVSAVISRELAFIQDSIAPLLNRDRTLRNRFDEAVDRAGQWFQEICFKTENGIIRRKDKNRMIRIDKKPGVFDLNADDYTLAERAKIYEQYTAKGGFVGLMSYSTPLSYKSTSTGNLHITRPCLMREMMSLFC